MFQTRSTSTLTTFILRLLCSMVHKLTTELWSPSVSIALWKQIRGFIFWLESTKIYTANTQIGIIRIRFVRFWHLSNTCADCRHLLDCWFICKFDSFLSTFRFPSKFSCFSRRIEILSMKLIFQFREFLVGNLCRWLYFPLRKRSLTLWLATLLTHLESFELYITTGRFKLLMLLIEPSLE